MNYASYWISGLAMAPTYVVGALLAAGLSPGAWVLTMFLVLCGSSFVYWVTVLRAVRDNQSPARRYTGLIITQLVLYTSLVVVLMR